MDIYTDRAAKIIRTNRYLSLATSDVAGPWIAPINYVVGPGNYLHFYSARTSRHSKAIQDEALVAVALFDSTAIENDVDGMQARATCSRLSGADLQSVHEHYFTVNYDDEGSREWWYRPVEDFNSEGIWAFYRVLLEDLYLIDLDSIERDRVDRRLPVDISALWKLLASEAS